MCLIGPFLLAPQPVTIDRGTEYSTTHHAIIDIHAHCGYNSYLYGILQLAIHMSRLIPIMLLKLPIMLGAMLQNFVYYAHIMLHICKPVFSTNSTCAISSFYIVS